MAKQVHSHPILNRPVQEKRSEPKKVIPVEEEIRGYEIVDTGGEEIPFTTPPLLPAIRPKREKKVRFADPSTLQLIADQATAIEKRFSNRSVLFIGAECYDAPTITVIEGLQELGFTIYTLNRQNVNSWFCNTVVNDISNLKFDFILSNLQWGVRWSYYEEYNLNSYPKVLIDGCDNHGDLTWKQKITRVRKRWKRVPGDDVLSRQVQPYQWGESEKGYRPDIVFASQLFPGYDAIYQPFGIQREFVNLAGGLPTTDDRSNTFLFIAGSGTGRAQVQQWVNNSPVEGSKVVSGVRGEAVIPDEIAPFIAKDGDDPGVHSWFRWVHYRGYFNLLRDTKSLIYSNVWKHHHWWDSKRPWEALASGCLIMTETPSIVMNDYPITTLTPFCVFQSQEELIDKCHWLSSHQSHFDKMRVESTELAYRYFTPVPLARRFLLHIFNRVRK